MTRLSGMNNPGYDPWKDTDDEPGELDSDSCHCGDDQDIDQKKNTRE